jgi:N-terminal domain from the human glycogen debranching enzyme
MSPNSTQSTRQVYVLPLTDDGAPDVPGDYLYLPAPGNKPYTLRFAIDGTSSICRQGSLWVNFPEAGQEFDRYKFREFKLVQACHQKNQLLNSRQTLPRFQPYPGDRRPDCVCWCIRLLHYLHALTTFLHFLFEDT